jgi:hypothetical protein
MFKKTKLLIRFLKHFSISTMVTDSQKLGFGGVGFGFVALKLRGMDNEVIH